MPPRCSPFASLADESGRTPVGQHDRQPVLDAGGVEATGGELRQRVEGGRVLSDSRREQARARRRLVDPDRVCERGLEDDRVGGREQVRQDAVRDRGDSHGNVTQRPFQPGGGDLRAVDPRGGADLRAGQHRARGVDHDEHLRVRPNVQRAALLVGGLGGCDPEQPGERDHRRDRYQAASPRELWQPEARPQACRPPGDEQ